MTAKSYPSDREINRLAKAAFQQPNVIRLILSHFTFDELWAMQREKQAAIDELVSNGNFDGAQDRAGRDQGPYLLRKWLDDDRLTL